MKTLLTVFIICLFIFYTKSNQCSKLYFTAFFGEDSACLKLTSYYNCETVFQNIYVDCSRAGSRKLMTFFNSTCESYFTCVPGFNLANCNIQLGNIDEDGIIMLNKTHRYGFKEFFRQKLEPYKQCHKNSLSIFLIGISCTSISSYPDLDELVGSGLKETQQYFLEQNLHGIIIWADADESNFMRCNNSAKHLKFEPDNFLESRFVNYSNKGAVDKKIFNPRNICDTPIPRYKIDYHNNLVKKDPIANQIIITITCAIVFGLIIAWIGFWAQRVKRRYDESKIEAFADQHASSKRHILFGKYRDEWEVTPKELKIDAGTVLGQGAFGKVYLGHLKKQRNKEWIEMDVAVKFTHDSSDEKTRKEMIEEIGFMKALGRHENLLVMVGYLKSIENPMICTVYCSNGDLLKILRKHPLHFMSKEKCHNVEICLLLPDLLRIAIEVCNGLEYLSLHNYVHRDIAARNILLTDQMVAKLGDFGMCKKLELNDICIIDKNGKFPIRHMCYESLKFGEFSLKTDVWSFGILIFEMFSGGESPFKEIPLEEFVKYLEQDGKPKFSQETPKPLVQFLNEKVFQKYPSRRAEFKELKKELSQFYSIVLSVVQKL